MTESGFLEIARIDTCAGCAGRLLQESPVEAEVKRSDAQQVSQDQLLGFEQSPIQERTTATAQVFHPPARSGSVQDGVPS
jgi:hypothetical protein